MKTTTKSFRFRVNEIYRHYILAGFGWEIQTLPEMLMRENIGKQIAKDLLFNLHKLFKRHKTYIKKECYHLTILPFKGVLSILTAPFFFPTALVHELTHALAIQYTKSYFWIILLPLITELPFFILILPLFPLWLQFIGILVGMTGFISVSGDFQIYMNMRKNLQKEPTLSWLFDNTRKKSKRR